MGMHRTEGTEGILGWAAQGSDGTTRIPGGKDPHRERPTLNGLTTGPFQAAAYDNYSIFL
jgi:hypothetical protein